MNVGIDWSLALLKNDPFPDVPPRNATETIWAGMSQLKTQFDELLIEAQTTAALQVVLNWGAYGSGKTHAATYFSILNDPPMWMQLTSLPLM